MPRYLLPCRVLTQLALRRFLGRAIFGPFAERIAQRNDYRDKLKHEQNYKRSQRGQRLLSGGDADKHM